MSYQLLLVEYDPRRVRAVADSLRRSGYQVEIISTGDGPVDVDELQARVDALLCPVAAATELEISTYEFGGMKVDFRKSEVEKYGSIIELSERENRLLQYFIQNRGKIVSRGVLLHQVWGYRREPLTRTVDVHIVRLRRKLEKDPRDPRFIITVHGLGYRFDG